MANTLGSCADQLFTFESEIKQKKEDLCVLEKKRNDLRDAVMGTMAQHDQTLAAGNVGKIQLKYKKIPVVKPENWDLFYNYIHASHAYHLLHKRLSVTAVLEELEGGEEIPVDIVTTKTLKISKL